MLDPTALQIIQPGVGQSKDLFFASILVIPCVRCNKVQYIRLTDCLESSFSNKVIHFNFLG
jgi:hypothetical protein